MTLGSPYIFHVKYMKNVWVRFCILNPFLLCLKIPVCFVCINIIVSHVVGVVRFETKFVVLSPSITEQENFVSTKNVLSESTSLSVNWNDGDRLDVTVRAYDIFDVHAEDMVTVYKDTSKPEVENLWLSSGDLVNISVHSIEDFSQMT